MTHSSWQCLVQRRLVDEQEPTSNFKPSTTILRCFKGPLGPKDNAVKQRSCKKTWCRSSSQSTWWTKFVNWCMFHTNCTKQVRTFRVFSWAAKSRSGGQPWIYSLSTIVVGPFLGCSGHVFFFAGSQTSHRSANDSSCSHMLHVVLLAKSPNPNHTLCRCCEGLTMLQQLQAFCS